MEKRTLLAVVLSLLILYIYSVLAPRPAKNLAKNIQVSENKEGVSYKAFPDPTSAPSPDVVDPLPLVAETVGDDAEQLTRLETNRLLIEFSNIGGNIKSVTIKKHNYTFLPFGFMGLERYAQSGFELARSSGQQVVYSLIADGIRIERIYHVSDDRHLIEAVVRLSNVSDMSKEIVLTFDAFRLDFSSLDNKAFDSREQSLLEYSVAADSKIFRKGGAVKFSAKEKKEVPGAVQWAGFRDRYFCAVVKPEFDVSKYIINPAGEEKLIVGLEADRTTLKPNGIIELWSKIYVGPQSVEPMSEYGLGIEKIISFSGFGLFNWTAMIFHKVLIAMHKVIASWGLCIILLSILVYAAMYPLTFKGMSSMKRMQALQPKITQIRDKYKDNPQKMNKEVMGLYKENKINPFGGCLPFLLQMPVFIGLYQVLWRSVELKGAGFLWIADLSMPDRLFLLPNEVPFLGNEINILPVVMMVVMFLQQKFSARSMTTMDSAQASQQKMMMIIFPVFLGAIFYKFASGLCLYFTVFYVFSTITQWKMSKTVIA